MNLCMKIRRFSQLLPIIPAPILNLVSVKRYVKWRTSDYSSAQNKRWPHKEIGQYRVFSTPQPCARFTRLSRSLGRRARDRQWKRNHTPARQCDDAIGGRRRGPDRSNPTHLTRIPAPGKTDKAFRIGTPMRIPIFYHRGQTCARPSLSCGGVDHSVFFKTNISCFSLVLNAAGTSPVGSA
jgi:hypothetical protein